MKKTKKPVKPDNSLDHLITDSNSDTPATANKSGLAAALKTATTKTVPHLIIEARAGTGKTTTLIEGLKLVKGLPSTLTPSPQQAAVWASMALSKDAVSICFVAFNKSIANELQTRVPAGCDAMTMHSMGNRAVSAAFGKLDVNQYRVQDIIGEILGKDIREVKRFQPALVSGVEELVGLCKNNLINFERTTLKNSPGAENDIEQMWWEDQLDQLTSYYDVELNGKRDQVYELVPKVLKRCMEPDRDKAIDFDDMVWLPVVLDLPLRKYDLLLVDEAQDLNRCQQALAKKAGKRLILCGDPKQAIYGFAGADAESMPRMHTELSATPVGCALLPLTVTRRCGKAIVVEANKYVADIEAFETNPAGIITKLAYAEDTNPAAVDTQKVNYRNYVQDGDMLLCRVNAPLVSQCFKFLKAGRKANIQGRDIGKGLVRLVEKLKCINVAELVGKLSDWKQAEAAKELAKRQPNENKLAALQDKYDCLCCFCEDQATVADVITKINAVFTDDKQSAGIRLSSIHKAKGLEAKNVFLLRPKGAECPHPMAKTKWAKEQEHNLLYVAITRAIEVFTYVS